MCIGSGGRRVGVALAATALVLGLGVAGCGDDGEGGRVRLDASYPPGTYRIRSVLSAAAAASPDGVRFGEPERVTHAYEMRLTVPPADAEGRTEAELTFERIHASEEQGPRKAAYDSAAGPEGQDRLLALRPGSLVGETVRIVLGPRGKVEAVTGADAAWDRAAAETPRYGPLLREAKGPYGDESLAGWLGRGAELLPAEPVGPGEAWEGETELPVPGFGPMPLRFKGTLLEVRPAEEGTGRVAVVEVTGTVGLDEPRSRQAGLARVTFDRADLALKTRMELDLAAELVTLQTTDVEGTIEATLKPLMQPELRSTTRLEFAQEMRVVPEGQGD
jgi:hypothetical protein